MKIIDNTKIVITVSSVVFTLLLSSIAFFTKQQFEQLEMLTSQFTGHLIAHGQTDTELNDVRNDVKIMKYNNYILCKYGEQTWPNHDKCKPN